MEKMTARKFAYFLQGIFEIGEVEELNEAQVKLIREKLNAVFRDEIDSQYQDAEESQDIHDGKKTFSRDMSKVKSPTGNNPGSAPSPVLSGNTAYAC